MAGTIPAVRQHLIDAIAEEARRHRTVLPPKAVVAFINSYYRGVDEDDMREAGAETLALAAISHLELGKQRRRGDYECSRRRRSRRSVRRPSTRGHTKREQGNALLHGTSSVKEAQV